MSFTVFKTPVIRSIFKLLSIIILKLTGWKFSEKKHFTKKAVMIAAPHTSNWDFFYTILIALEQDMNVSWMGKDSLFKGPGGWFLKWLGGVPVDRSKNNNLVDDIVKEFNSREKFIILVPPEGTRSLVDSWKTGFYHIAHKAEVPILMGFLDFKFKVGGIGPAFIPSGKIEKDMKIIKSFYANITGKYPELTTLPTNTHTENTVSKDMKTYNSTMIFPTNNPSAIDMSEITSYYKGLINTVRPKSFM